MNRTAWLLGLALVLLSGCGSGEPVLLPVEGRILYNGQPLDAGLVIFTPDAERGNSGPLAWAEIQRDGRFRLHSDDRPGVVAGWHRVSVAGACRGYVVPAHYRDPERARLSREISAGGGPVELHLD